MTPSYSSSVARSSQIDHIVHIVEDLNEISLMDDVLDWHGERIDSVDDFTISTSNRDLAPQR